MINTIEFNCLEKSDLECINGGVSDKNAVINGALGYIAIASTPIVAVAAVALGGSAAIAVVVGCVGAYLVNNFYD